MIKTTLTINREEVMLIIKNHYNIENFDSFKLSSSGFKGVMEK